MNKISIALMAFDALAFFSCEEKKKEPQKPPVEIRVLDEIPSIVEAHGTIGEGSSMNVMEFLGDDGDTVYIRVPGQAVMGGVRVGDHDVRVLVAVRRHDRRQRSRLGAVL